MKPLQTGPPDNADLANQPVRNHDYFFHENFSFDDDVWDLSYRATVARPSQGRIHFDSLPPKVKNEVKEFIANRILAVGLSNGSAQRSMVAIRKSLRFLAQRQVMIYLQPV